MISRVAVLRHSPGPKYLTSPARTTDSLLGRPGNSPQTLLPTYRVMQVDKSLLDVCIFAFHPDPARRVRAYKVPPTPEHNTDGDT